MTTTHPTPETLIPLTPAVFHILLALADGEKHGYGIMQEVMTITQGEVKMGPGTAATVPYQAVAGSWID